MTLYTDGAVVVCRRSNDSAVLLAYRKLPDNTYMVAVFTRGRLRAFSASFSDLLDVVPIRAAILTTKNALRADVRSTLDAWVQVCKEALAAAGRPLGEPQPPRLNMFNRSPARRAPVNMPVE